MPKATPQESQAQTPDTPEDTFKAQIEAAQAAEAMAVQVVYPGQPGAVPALRVDH